MDESFIRLVAVDSDNGRQLFTGSDGRIWSKMPTESRPRECGLVTLSRSPDGRMSITVAYSREPPAPWSRIPREPPRLRLVE